MSILLIRYGLFNWKINFARQEAFFLLWNQYFGVIMNYCFVQDVLDHKYEASTGICSSYHRYCSFYRYVLSPTHFLKMILYRSIFENEFKPDENVSLLIFRNRQCHWYVKHFIFWYRLFHPHANERFLIVATQVVWKLFCLCNFLLHLKGPLNIHKSIL